MSLSLDILRSWACEEGNVNSNTNILAWLKSMNENIKAIVRPCSISESTFWFYDDYNGEILNRKRSFFSVKGMRLFINDRFICEQPIIIQPEIGYLGIICKKIDGVLHFLMQAKIEPGNVNCVQVSPTIQATKSNFMRAHGGVLPKYFKQFEEASKYRIIYDQVQSEQGSRFYRKRNRNIIIDIGNEDIQVYPEFRWMTLGQIKKLMKIDNLVNMDTRTVLSGLPLSASEDDKEELRTLCKNNHMFSSIFETDPYSELPKIFHLLNTYKMFHSVSTPMVPLNQLVNWRVDEYGITSVEPANFEVKYYDIDIEGREVQRWNQPLFKSLGCGIFAILVKRDLGHKDKPYKFLVRLKQEIGYCDKVELGPAIQWEYTHEPASDDEVERYFRNVLDKTDGTMIDVLLSEEGGRFYHEQNRNIVKKISDDALKELPPNYMWVSYSTLNALVQCNNVLNIQLRNILSLLDL